jgi:hypothetical protein
MRPLLLPLLPELLTLSMRLRGLKLTGGRAVLLPPPPLRLPRDAAAAAAAAKAPAPAGPQPPSLPLLPL